MADGPLKNLEVLQEQARDAVVENEADLVAARHKWKNGEYLGAIKTATFGLIAGWYRFAWRWILYRDVVLVIAIIWLAWKGYRIVG
jgi:hypothetical protein